MKKGFIFLLTSVIFLSINAFSQIDTVYYENFETGSTRGGYIHSDSARKVTDLYTSPGMAMRLKPSKTAGVGYQYVELSPIRMDRSKVAWYLTFNHISKIDRSQFDTNTVTALTIQYKMGLNSTNWITLSSSIYDRSWGGGSSSYDVSTSFFDARAYSIWNSGNPLLTPQDSWWKKEYFNLSTFRTQGSNDTLCIRFILPRIKSNEDGKAYGWLVDDITVVQSSTEMLLPTIQMLDYPDPISYPASRPAHISAIIKDSNANHNYGNIAEANVYYKTLGATTFTKLPMARVVPGSTTDFTYYCDIPFFGFDTLVSWYLEAIDASANRNRLTFPLHTGVSYTDTDTLMTYKSVRSINRDTNFYQFPGAGVSSFPFASDNKYVGRFQYVYDSTSLKNLGYKAGNIKGVSFNINTVVPGIQLQGYTIKMANAPSNTSYSSRLYNTTLNFKTVYTGVINIDAVGWNYIQFDREFKWNGEGDVVMQICFYTPNPTTSTTTVKLIATAAGKQSIEYARGTQPSTTDCSAALADGDLTSTRPDVRFNMVVNPPLFYDAGISRISEPSTFTQGNVPQDIKVVLRNYGDSTLRAVKIQHSIDGVVQPVYAWSDAAGIPPQGERIVTVGRNVMFSSGIRKICAWTLDTLNGTIYDYEPLNNMVCDSFVSCHGKLSGTKKIGGSGADYPNFEYAFEVLRYCGVGGHLTLQIDTVLWDGIALKFPTVIPGLSDTSTITFEPLAGSTAPVTLRWKSARPDTIGINLGNNKYIRFRKLNFVSNDNSSPEHYFVRMNANNQYITFDSCTFSSVGNGLLNAYIFSSEGSNITIKNSSFTGASTAIQMEGLGAMIMAPNNKILNNVFSYQKSNAVYLKSQKTFEVIGNTFVSDNTALEKPVLNLEVCTGASKVSKNTINSSGGATCISLSNVNGSGNDYTIVDNNMLTASGNASTALNIIQGKKIKVVYNSVLSHSTDPQSTAFGVAAGTSSVTLDSSYVYNNIFVSNNRGTAVIVRSRANNNSTRYDYNLYYSADTYLGKFLGNSYRNLPAWVSATTQDSNSLSFLPNFISSTDLRAYDLDLCEAGIAIPEVSYDLYGDPRPTSPDEPCIGILEFPRPPVNIEMIRFDAPESFSCMFSDTVQVTVSFRNAGTDTIHAGTYSLSYRIGTNVVTETTTPEIIPGTIVSYAFVGRANLSVTSFRHDSVFTITAWSSHLQDIAPANDTVRTKIQSYYNIPALPYREVYVNYGDPFNIAAKTTPSPYSIYWYADSLSAPENWVYRGDTLHTGPNYEDTVYFISQKNEHEILKITEIQSNRTPADGGLTIGADWITAVSAVEITNLGDVDINLSDYLFRDATSNTNNNEKKVRLPNVTLPKGSSYVIQLLTTLPTSYDSTITKYYTYNAQLHNFVNSLTSTPRCFFALTRIKGTDSTIVDVAILNNLSRLDFPPAWINQGANLCWTGPKSWIIPSGAPGLRRINPTSTDSTGWIACSSVNPMTMGSIEDNMILYHDNGCYGDKSSIKMIIDNRPDTNILLTALSVPTWNCGLGEEPIVITVRNSGLDTIANIPVQYAVNGGSPVYDTIRDTLRPGNILSFEFGDKFDFSSGTSEKQFIVVAKITLSGNVSRDTILTSDTIISYVMPQTPSIDTSQLRVSYGEYAHITPGHAASDSLVWYDSNLQVLDTALSYTLGPLYADTLLYVKSLSTRNNYVQVGNGVTVNSYNGYPSPYSALTRYSKYQLMIKADELRQMGYSRGIIKSLSFYVQAVQNATNIVMDTFRISIGGTSSNEVVTTAWTPNMTEVYSVINDTLTQIGWKEHVFQVPYYWDGQENLIIQTCFSANPATFNSGSNYFGVQMRNTSVNFYSTLYRATSAPLCESMVMASVGKQMVRPNMKLAFQEYACESQAVPAQVTVAPIPDLDLEMVSIVHPTGIGVTYDYADTIKILVTNRGIATLSAAKFNISTGNQQFDTLYQFDVPLAQGRSTIASISMVGHITVSEGEYCFKAINLGVQAQDSLTLYPDSIFTDFFQGNDTIEGCVSFCIGNTTFTIDQNPINPADFRSFTEAVNKLRISGICGSIIVDVAPGVYTEQIVLPSIQGASAVNTITFRSQNGDNSSVKLQYAATRSDSNFVLRLDGAQYVTFENMTIYAQSNSFARAVEILDSASNISFVGNVIKVTGSIPVTTLLNLDMCAVYAYGDMSKISFLSNIIDSSHVSVYMKSVTNSHYIDNVILRGNTLRHFYYRGVDLDNVRETQISNNTFYSSLGSLNKRALMLAHSKEGFKIDQNFIYLLRYSGEKSGIYISNTTADPGNPSLIANNMISSSLTLNSSAVCYGINVDSSSYVNVYFNSVRMDVGSSARCLNATKNSGTINVVNNLLANFRQGYALYSSGSSDITRSDYNNYYSTTSNFAYWNGVRNSLANLRSANRDDANSQNIMPVFENDTTLRLRYPDLSDMAEYMQDIPVDIYDTTRPSTPKPCIGAHEYPLCDYDLAVMNVVISPTASFYCDGDSILIRATIKNYGVNTIIPADGAMLRAYIEGEPGTLISTPINENIAYMVSKNIAFTQYLKIPYGSVVGGKTLVVYTDFPRDCKNINDTLRTSMTMRPAFNLSIPGAGLSPTDSTGNCNLTHVVASVTIRNGGARVVPAGSIVKACVKIYWTGSYPDSIKNQLPDTIRFCEFITLPTALSGAAAYTHFFSVNPLNLYPPVNTPANMPIRYAMQATIEMDNEYDLSGNVFTLANFVSSYVNPRPPKGEPEIVNIPYATWVTLVATQDNTGISNNSIRWYSDTNKVQIRTGAAYETRQSFADSMYYLQVTSSAGCKSPFGKVQVKIIMPRGEFDAGCAKIVEPVVNRVYMGKNTDTVKVEIINYGTRAISNFPVTYLNTRTTGGVAQLQKVTETCTASIAPGARYTFKFDSAMYIDPYTIQTYRLTAWTELQGDTVHLNDTVFRDSVSVITPLSESRYGTSTASTRNFLDITRVTLGLLDNVTPAIGNILTKAYDRIMDTNLILYKGYKDTLYVACENPSGNSGIEQAGWVKAYIDWNRDGNFDETTECVLSDTARESILSKSQITVPANAITGFTKMRVVLVHNGNRNAVTASGTYANGETEEYMILVRAPYQTNAALERILEPDNIIEMPPADSPYPPTTNATRTRDVKVKLRNLGETILTSATIKCVYNDTDTVSLSWTGNLAIYESESVQLDVHDFVFGKTRFIAWVEFPNGGLDYMPQDDTIKTEFNRFHIVNVPFKDNFDSYTEYFQAPSQKGKNRNLWELGVPLKSPIDSAYSAPNAWVTDLINNYPIGNKSVLYSPFFNVDFRQADTLSFYLRKDMVNKTLLRVEFLDYQNEWILLNNWDTSNHWYNSIDTGFTRTNSRYQKFYFPLALKSSDFGTLLQLRYTFISQPDAPAPTRNGVAIDDFELGLERILKDVGVIAVIEPTNVNYGQMICPTILVKNFGKDTVENIPVSYIPKGGSQSFIAREDTIRERLAPGDSIAFTFTNACFEVTPIFMDSLQILAATDFPGDVYEFNDSINANVIINPLLRDVGIMGIDYPGSRVIAGNNFNIYMNVRNFGSETLSSIPITYMVENAEPVTEIWTFDHPLESGAAERIFFLTPIRASFGTFKIKIFTGLEDDYYHGNDTARIQVVGDISGEDISADYLVIDASDPNYFKIQIAYTNRGATVQQNVKVSFFIDGDPSTARTEVDSARVPSNGQGNYIFREKLPRRATPYKICGYVYHEQDTDRSNDTTCATRPLTVDVAPVDLLIEERSNSDVCFVQMVIANKGSYVVTDAIQTEIHVGGQVYSQEYKGSLRPRDSVRLNYEAPIPKSANHVYNVLSIATTARDNNRSNDTTNRWRIVDRLPIGIETVDATVDEDAFWLGQNYPNPFRDETNIKFGIPAPGNIRLFIYDINGKLVFSTKKRYDTGEHIFKFNQKNLAPGVYYYGIEYNGRRLAKKMIINR